jgi:hypothetical protein
MVSLLLIKLGIALIFCITVNYSFNYRKIGTKTGSNLQSLLATMSGIDSHVHVWTDGSIPFAYSGNIYNDSTTMLPFI